MTLTLTDDDGTSRSAVVEILDDDRLMVDATAICQRDHGVDGPSSVFDAVHVLLNAGCEGSWDPTLAVSLNWGA